MTVSDSVIPAPSLDWRDDLKLLREDLVSLGLPIPERLALDDWAASLRQKPTTNTLVAVGLATLLFYGAEKGRNPKVNDIYDAMVYCTTNLSVGYSDIFAKTPLGKMIGSALMTFGPAMAARMLDGPVEQSETKNLESEILSTLQQILAKMNEPRDGRE